jgi:hypothetical protein
MRDVVIFFASHRYAPSFNRMFELPMTAALGNLYPAVPLNQLKDVPVFHQAFLSLCRVLVYGICHSVQAIAVYALKFGPMETMLL